MTAPVMNSMNQPVMQNIPNMPDNTMVNAAMPAAPVMPINQAMPVIPGMPAVPVNNNVQGQDAFMNSAEQIPAVMPVASAMPVNPGMPATPVNTNNVQNQDTFVNSVGQVPTTAPASPITPKEDIWSKEIAPGIPAGHTENDPNNAAMNQKPAASQLQQPAKKSSKLKTLLMLGIVAALGGLAYVKRKELPNVGNYLKNLKIGDSLKNFKTNSNVKSLWQDRGPVTTPERLEQYAQDFFKTANPKVKEIKIHHLTLNKDQKMSKVVSRVMQIASDASTLKNKDKWEVDIILKPEYQNKAGKIRGLLNARSVSNFNGRQSKLLDNAIEKISMKKGSEQFLDKVFLGKNRIKVNVGYIRTVDGKISWYNKIGSFFSNGIKDKVPKYEN